MKWYHLSKTGFIGCILARMCPRFSWEVRGLTKYSTLIAGCSILLVKKVRQQQNIELLSSTYLTYKRRKSISVLPYGKFVSIIPVPWNNCFLSKFVSHTLFTFWNVSGSSASIALYHEPSILHQFTEQRKYLHGVQDEEQSRISLIASFRLFFFPFMLFHVFAVKTGKRRFYLEPQS